MRCRGGLDHDGVGARAFTDTRSFQFDALRDDLDDGPCIECLRTEKPYDLEPVASQLA